MPQRNQYKPCPPEDLIREPLTMYFSLGINDKNICKHLKDHYDTELYGLSVVSLRRLRKTWRLDRTRVQKHTFESIAENVRKIRQRFPFRGAEAIRRNLREQHQDHVPRELVNAFLKTVEPRAVEARKHRQFKRRRYWAAGVNDAWAQDQHDKWGRFGLFLHCSLDAYTGSINWLKAWWTNSNPRLIAKLYIDCGRMHGGVPVITQSDPGSENFAVANAQTFIRHRLDASLGDTRQHRWMIKHQNILSEIKWSVFRRDFSPGFEDILEQGVHEGWYDVNDTLQNLIFRWLVIPWIQAEIDEWVLHRNRNAPRANKHKILPHGIPDLIRAKPHMYGSLDFKISVPPELFDEAEMEYAPPDDPVFQLVPPVFDTAANMLYHQLGRPEVSSNTLWDVYRQLLLKFHERAHDVALEVTLSDHGVTLAHMAIPTVQLLPNLQELSTPNVSGPAGYQYMGGMRSPPTTGLRNVKIWVTEGQESDPASSGRAGDSDDVVEPEYVLFSSDEDDEDDEEEEEPRV